MKPTPPADATADGEPGRHISRRALLAGGFAGVVGASALGGLAVQDGMLPGRTTLHRLLGLNGPAGSIPDVASGRMSSGAFNSRARLGTRTAWSIAYPPGRSATPLRPLIVLHGRGGDHHSAFGDQLGLDRFLAQAVAQGTTPFAIASVDGGDHSYWHRRASGDDAGAMVLTEFLPLLAAHGLDTSRVAFLGWSMGGYGGLWLGGQLGARRVAAVVAESPAIWRHAADTAQGSFDDAEDLAQHTVFGRQQQLAGVAVRVDCGTGDGFCPVAREYARSLTPAPAGGFEPGAHDLDYWRRMAPAQLQFVGQHLPTASG
ncbi:alpha/beta hydrolase [soil metagenome]